MGEKILCSIKHTQMVYLHAEVRQKVIPIIIEVMYYTALTYSKFWLCQYLVSRKHTFPVLLFWHNTVSIADLDISYIL